MSTRAKEFDMLMARNGFVWGLVGFIALGCVGNEFGTAKPRGDDSGSDSGDSNEPNTSTELNTPDEGASSGGASGTGETGEGDAGSGASGSDGVGAGLGRGGDIGTTLGVGGSTGPGGAGAASGSSGGSDSTGAGNQAGSGAVGTGPDCKALAEEAETKLKLARFCGSAIGLGTCTTTVDGICCPVLVADPASAETQDYLNALAAFKVQCSDSFDCTLVGCGGIAGACVDQYCAEL